MLECPNCKSMYFDHRESLEQHLLDKHGMYLAHQRMRLSALAAKEAAEKGLMKVPEEFYTDRKMAQSAADNAAKGLPTDDKARKRLAIYTYETEYFPDAFLAELEVAVAGNEQHNPGEPLHWARCKSKDQMNTARRHIWDYGRGVKKDTDGQWHLAKAIWRLKAQLQLDIEAERNAATNV